MQWCFCLLHFGWAHYGMTSALYGLPRTSGISWIFETSLNFSESWNFVIQFESLPRVIQQAHLIIGTMLVIISYVCKMDPFFLRSAWLTLISLVLRDGPFISHDPRGESLSLTFCSEPLRLMFREEGPSIFLIRGTLYWLASFASFLLPSRSWPPLRGVLTPRGPHSSPRQFLAGSPPRDLTSSLLLLAQGSHSHYASRR